MNNRNFHTDYWDVETRGYYLEMYRSANFTGRIKAIGYLLRGDGPLITEYQKPKPIIRYRPKGRQYYCRAIR